MEMWQLFSIIGTISFSVQGALIAMEKKFDLFAVYLFGIITAFGGGALRYVIIGETDFSIWVQRTPFFLSIFFVTLIILFPHFFIKSKWLWTNLLDAIGLISFAMEGALTAVAMGLPVSAVVVAALLTATGGGIFRDLLSQRKPILLQENVYGVWVVLVGLVIGLGLATTEVHLLAVFILFTGLRVLSFLNNWKIPYRNIDI